MAADGRGRAPGADSLRRPGGPHRGGRSPLQKGWSAPRAARAGRQDRRPQLRARRRRLHAVVGERDLGGGPPAGPRARHGDRRAGLGCGGPVHRARSPGAGFSGSNLCSGVPAAHDLRRRRRRVVARHRRSGFHTRPPEALRPDAGAVVAPVPVARRFTVGRGPATDLRGRGRAPAVSTICPPDFSRRPGGTPRCPSPPGGRRASIGRSSSRPLSFSRPSSTKSGAPAGSWSLALFRTHAICAPSPSP
jgi:hypothetical protein